MTRHAAWWHSGGFVARTLKWCAVLNAALWYCAFSSAGHFSFAAELDRGEDAAVASDADEGLSESPAADVPSKKTPTQKNFCPTFRVRPQDQIWVVSTRHLGCPYSDKQEPNWQLWRYEKGWWQPRTAAEFYAQDSADLVTPFYIHGNRVEAGQANSDGLDVYFQLVGKLDEEPPVRFVIWSWPSSQIKGQLKDVRAKADRSDVDAYYLGRFLAEMKPEVKVGLVGYSYGARIVSGALHLLGDGTLLGWQLLPGQRPQIRVALWAAAEHSHWYIPGNFHGRAPAMADAWFVTVNPCDPVLARYHMLDKCSCPSAVGYAGIYGRNLLPADVNARIEEVNVSNIVGGTHDMHAYLYSLYVQGRTRQYVLWHELEITKATEAHALAATK